MKAGIGTVIHGTLRSEDLIPTFAEELELLDEQKKFVYFVKEANKFKAWEDGEKCGWLIDRLMVALSEFAPDGCYFGATEGDGSDFGFWAIEDDNRS